MYLIVTLLILGFKVFSAVEADVDIQPNPIRCSIIDVRDWILGQNRNIWKDVLTGKRYELFCGQIDILIINVAGCADRFLTTLGYLSVDNVDEWETKLTDFYYYMAVAQQYCNTNDLDKVCDSNSIDACAARTVGITQDLFQTTDDLGKICQYFNEAIVLMKDCFEASIDKCNAQERAQLTATLDLTYKYFEDIGTYCEEGCEEILPLITGQMDNCTYFIDYSKLRWQDYCQQVQRAIDCIYNATKDCNKAVPDDYMTKSIHTALLYGHYFGCKLTVEEKTYVDYEDVDLVTLPSCARACVDCFFQLQESVGVKRSLNEQFGGWNFFDILSAYDDYFGSTKMETEGYKQVCGIINGDIAEPVDSCISKISKDCADVSDASNYGKALKIIEKVTGYIEDACDEGCSDLQPIFLEVAECTSKSGLEKIGVTAITVDIVLGLISDFGGQTTTCQSLSVYFNCTVAPFNKCPIFYKNWVDLISSYSEFDYTLAFCGMYFNAKDGSFGLSPEDSDDPVFAFKKNSGEGLYSRRSIILSAICLVFCFIKV